MTGLVFVDTNVLISSLDPGEPEKRAKATALLATGAHRRALVTSPQTLNECYRILTRKRTIMPIETAREFISALVPTCTAPLDPATTRLAWLIEDRTSYSWWDCLMLAAALRARCRVFATEDLGHGQLVDDMRIVNPLRADLDTIFAAD